MRIEDVDTPRVIKHSDSRILRDIESFGLYWDGEVDYQSQQFDYYESIIQDLLDRNFCYACSCSRRYLKSLEVDRSEFGLIYPGLCRDKKLSPDNQVIRIDTQEAGIPSFVDLHYGTTNLDIHTQVGDFILKRADGIYAYHLAVVLDDFRQGINQIVRGADLLKITCLHIFLQQSLKLPTPEYLHIPLVMNEQGKKLSKQFGAKALDMNKKSELLTQALIFLDQQIEPGSEHAQVEQILNHAVANWDVNCLPKETLD